MCVQDMRQNFNIYKNLSFWLFKILYNFDLSILLQQILVMKKTYT